MEGGESAKELRDVLAEEDEVVDMMEEESELLLLVERVLALVWGSALTGVFCCSCCCCCCSWADLSSHLMPCWACCISCMRMCLRSEDGWV